MIKQRGGYVKGMLDFIQVLSDNTNPKMEFNLNYLNTKGWWLQQQRKLPLAITEFKRKSQLMKYLILQQIPKSNTKHIH